MAVGKLLLVILLGILVIALLLTLILLCSRIWVRYQGQNKNHHLYIGVGFIRLQVLPRRKRSSEKAKVKSPKTAEEDKPSDTPASKRDLGAIAYQVLDLLEDMKDSLRIRTLKLRVMLGTPDAAKTGILLGTCGAIAGMVYPYLEQNFNIRDCRIAVDADFEASKTQWEAEAECSVRFIKLLWVLLHDRRKLRELKDLLKIDEEEKT